MASSTPQRVVERLLARADTADAEQAGIRLRDKPMWNIDLRAEL